MNFEVLGPPAKVFSAKIGGHTHPHIVGEPNNPQKFSPQISYYLPIRESFLTRMFPAIRVHTTVVFGFYHSNKKIIINSLTTELL